MTKWEYQTFAAYRESEVRFERAADVREWKEGFPRVESW